MAAASLLSTGCKEADCVEADALYNEMLHQADVYSQQMADILADVKSGRKDGLDTRPDYHAPDLGVLDNRFMGFIDSYACSDVPEQWDEKGAMARLSRDDSFSSAEKDVLVKAVAASHFLKGEFPVLEESKMTIDSCFKDYTKARKRAVVTCVIAFAAGLFGEPTPIVELAALANYCYDIHCAEEDYADCISRL